MPDARSCRIVIPCSGYCRIAQTSPAIKPASTGYGVDSIHTMPSLSFSLFAFHRPGSVDQQVVFHVAHGRPLWKKQEDFTSVSFFKKKNFLLGYFDSVNIFLDNINK